MATDTPNTEDLEWEERTLCSDEACIGVIGPNGRCNECGKPYAGKPLKDDGEPLDGLTLDSDDVLDEADADAFLADESADTDDVDLDDDAVDDHWADRILCRDENCIGVIGPDGCCKECGKPLEEKG